MKKRILSLLCAVAVMVTAFSIAFVSSYTDAASPDSYCLIDELDGFAYSNWSYTTGDDSVSVKTEYGERGSYVINSNWSYNKGQFKGAEIKSNSSYYLGEGDFTLTAAVYSTYSTNCLRPYAGMDWNNVYYEVAAGELSVRMYAYNTPVVYYGDTVLAVGESLIAPMYEMGSDGKYLLEGGNPVISVDADGNPNYANVNEYRNELRKAGLCDGNRTVTVDVVGNTVTVSLDYHLGNTVIATATLPENALSKASAVKVSAVGMSWYWDFTFIGAKLISQKLIADLAPVFSYPADAAFNNGDWIMEQGKTDAESDYFNVVFEENEICTGAGTITVISHKDLYSGDCFELIYTARRRLWYGNEATESIAAGMRVGDLYFGLSNGRMAPYVEYKSQVVYESDKRIYEYVNIDEELKAELDGYTSAGERANRWAEQEGENPTYKLTFNKGKFTVSYKTDKYPEVTVVDIDISDKVTGFVESKVAIASYGRGNGDACDNYTMIKLGYSSEAVDIGAMDDAVGEMADYADYQNYPIEFGALNTVAGLCPENLLGLLDNVGISAAYAAEHELYNTLGTVSEEHILIEGFKSDEWTKVSGNNLEFKDYGELTDCIYAQSTGGESVYTAGSFNLGNEFHLVHSGYMYYSNQQTYSHHAISIGDLTIDANRSKGTTTNSGHVVVVVSKGGVELARSADLTLDASTANTSGYISANPSTVLYNTYVNGKAHGGWFKADYVDGELTVTVNGRVMVETEVRGLDLSNAEVKLAAGAGAQGLVLFGLELNVPRVTQLYDINTQLGTLADVTDFTEYSPIATEYERLLATNLLTEVQLSAMTNAGKYELYKHNYAYDKGEHQVINDLIGYAPSCTAEGLTDGKQCAECGVITLEQVAIDATGHTEEIIHGHEPADYTEDGLTDGVKCSVCGEILVEQQVIYGLKVEQVNVSLGTDISVNYYVKYKDNSLNPQMHFKHLGENLNEQTVSGVWDAALSHYCFTFDGIAPQCIGDTIEAELFVGEDVIPVNDYTVSAYLDKLKQMTAAELDYSEEKHAAMLTLIDELLCYGGAAQEYREYKLGLLVNEGITESEYTALSQDEYKLTRSTDGTVEWKSASLYFDSVNRLKIKFTADSTEGLSFKINGADVPTEKIAAVAGAENTYVITTDAISATDFDKVYTFSVYSEDGKIAELTYSVNSYIYSKQNSSNVKIKRLAQRTHMYGEAAKAFAAILR